jgi:glycosyltransferase involved in cell wall biosynthesis
MKKVLVIAFFPPLPLPSPRIRGLAKYLPEFGWDPIILAASLPQESATQFRVIETPFRDILTFWKKLLRLNPEEDLREGIKKRFGIASRKSFLDFILTLGGEIINYPDAYRGWKPFALKAGNELLQQEDISAIISSSAPITCHLIARELKIKYGIPWLADFRDLWTQNHNYSYSPLRRLFDRRLELKTLAEADALTTVSQPWAEKLKAWHKSKTTHVITNGFDPEIVNIPPAKLTAKFTLTYTGTIYPGKQDPAKLFTALKEMISDGFINPNETEVRFYGAEIRWLAEEVERYKLTDIIKQYGKVPVEVARQKQRESQLLLLFDWEDPKEKGVYPGKIFEYLAARRPILATGGTENNVVEQLLNETKAGIHAPSVENIKNALKELYQEYKLRGEAVYQGAEGEINKYTHQEMARKFSQVLDYLVSGCGGIPLV